jgi:uroporphyrin-III C-methyltransferase / precorrin-2 dehydrogenase / sirohydrochlorin ferrochelatase
MVKERLVNGMGGPAEPQALIYPLSLRLQGRRAVVIGGGPVAVRRVAGLRAAGADVLVVSPELSPALADLASRGHITARTRAYVRGDLDGAWLVLACTDRPEVNAAVAADAERQRAWCVRADDAGASAAWVPAVGRVAGATVAVNAGRDPRRAALLRDRCVDAVTGATGPGAAGATPAGRGPGGTAGRVSIVGGGPGDPGLITVTGLQRLRAADVVIADRLAPLELLDELPEDVQVIDAAKVPGGPAMRQELINQALVDQARAGRDVVRLKGGDPFVFGRGREEVGACVAAGIAVEVVPGVTSAIAVPAAAGIPVTHRGLSQGFCVVAGHASAGGPGSTLDWAALARSGMTLVLLMAIEHLAETTSALLSAGMAPGTPGAAIAEGWTRQQRVVTAPLRDLAATVSSAGIANPAVVVIGEVAQFAPGAQPATGSSAAAAPRRILVLGGARSGKSAAAEQMLAGHGTVDYIATGAPAGSGDAEWDNRVREHRQRRPPPWRTVETLDLGGVLAAPVPAAPALIDCLTTWLARVMDGSGAWDARASAGQAVASSIDGLAEDWRRTRRHVIAVSNEVGSGVVPGTAAGRRFRDELGRLNAAIAAASDEVWLCTAGIARRLR